MKYLKKNDKLSKVKIDSSNLLHTINKLLNANLFCSLSQITCTDWIEDNYFALNYILTTNKRDSNLMVEVKIKRDNSEIDSLVDIYPQSEVMERDLAEMYGINFIGNKTLGDFSLEDWNDIPPLRREFDTIKYVNENYSFKDGRDDNKNVKVEAKRRKAEAKDAK